MTIRTCPTCQAALGVGGARGRQPVYCSGRCRTAAHRAAGVPTPLRQRRRWVGYLAYPHSTKLTPYWLPGGGWSQRDLNDSANWSDWDTARSRAADRRGFVLGDGIGCLTIGGCVRRGRVDPRALDVVREVSSYTEITWDGDGVQVIGLLDEAAPEPELRVAGLPARLASRPPSWVPLTSRRVGSATRLADLRVALDSCEGAVTNYVG